MRIPFRQGLVRVPANFLQLAAGKVSLVLGTNGSVISTLADGNANYLVTENLSISNAWVGPFVGGVDYWLYSDINTLTGVRTFGHTIYQPVDGPTAPATPLVDQHWFDTSTNVMKVWSGLQWVRKIRVFYAKLNQGALFVSMSINSPAFTGTQVGSLASQQATVGAFVYDNVGNPLKKGDGTFFTTEDTALTGIMSNTQVKFGSIVIEATADANLAAYAIVRFLSFNKVGPALNYFIDNGAYGIIDRAATVGEVVNVIMEGAITNEAWDWTAAGINAPLYVDNSGMLTTVAPASPIPVASVIDKSTILLRPSSLFLNTFNDPSTPSSAGNVAISVPPVDPLLPIAVGDNDPRITAVNPHIADFTVHLSGAQNTFLDTLSATSPGIVVRKSDNTGTTVTLTGPVSGISVTNGDGIAGNPTLALTDDLAALEGMTTTGLSVRSAASTWLSRQIVIAGDSTAGLTIADGTGVAGNPTIGTAGNVKSVQDLATAGLTTRSIGGAWGTASITSTDTPGFNIANGDGVAGNPTITFTQDLASLTHFSDIGIPIRKSVGDWVTRTIVAPGNGLTVTNGTGVAGNPTIAIANDLAAVEGIATTGLAVRKGTEDWDTTTITGESGEITITNSGGFIPGPTPTAAPINIGLTNVGTPVIAAHKKITTDAKGRITATTNVVNTDIVTSLGYTPLDAAGTIALAANLNCANFKLTNVATPTSGSDVANKSYVDGVASGLDTKVSVRATSTGIVTLSGVQVVDGVSLADGDRVLVKNQADSTTNGIYVVNAGGAWTRSADAIPGTTLSSGAYTFTEGGTENRRTGWVLSALDPIVAGVTALTFHQFSGAGDITPGAGITISGQTLSVVPSGAGTLVIGANNIDLAVVPAVGGQTYRSVTIDTYGRVTGGTNPTTISGYGLVDAQPLNANLTNISALSTTGFVSRTGSNTFVPRTIVGIANQTSISIGDGTTGNPTIGLADNLIAPGTGSLTVPAGTSGQEPGGADGGLRYDNTTSRFRMHEAGSWRNVGTLRTLSLVNPATSFTATQTNPTNDAATITFNITGELAGLEAIGSFGLSTRTNTGTWTTRAIQGTAGRIVVNNGTAVAGDPTIDLAPSIVAAGTYRSVTVDTYGRTTGGTNPTTIAGYGLTDAQPLATNLTNLTTFNTNGFVTQNSTGSFVGRTWSVAANSNTNLVLVNGDGVAGNPTIGLMGDLLAVAQLSATGFAVRTGAQTWAQRQLTGASNRITITNPTGVITDPMIDISAAYTGQSSITTVGTINSGIWNGTTIAPQYGGTGLSSVGGANTVFGINAAASAGEYKTVNGTANQITVTHGVGTITLSTPQDIGTASNVQFARTTVNQAQTNVQALTDAATVTVNLNSGTHMTLLATAGVGATRALGNPTNMVAGTMVVLKYTQDGAGGRALTFGSAYKFVGGSAPTFGGQALNAVNVLTFWCDGTNLYEVSRSLLVS